MTSIPSCSYLEIKWIHMRNRTEKAQRADSELRVCLVGMCLDEVNIFTCRLHWIGTIACSTLQRYTIFWKLPNESRKKKPQQIRTLCALSTEVSNVYGSSVPMPPTSNIVAFDIREIAGTGVSLRSGQRTVT